MTSTLLPPLSDGPRPWAAVMTAKVSQVLIATGSAIVAAANPSRYYLAISVGSGGSGAVLKPGSAIIGNEGYQLGTGFQTMEFFFARHGGIVQQDWYCRPTSGGLTVNVIEGLYAQSVGG